MNYFTKWPEANAVLSKGLRHWLKCWLRTSATSEYRGNYIMTRAVTCESRPIQEVLLRLGGSKTRTTRLHPQSDDMVERCIKTVKEHLTKGRRIPPEGLGRKIAHHLSSLHDSTGLTPASLVFGRKLRLPCDLLFGVPPDKERPTIDHAANIVDHLHDIHSYVRQHLKLAIDLMKTRYDRLASCVGYYEGD
jgi:hypothetical protein